MELRYSFGKWQIDEDGQPFCLVKITGDNVTSKQKLKIGFKLVEPSIEKHSIRDYLKTLPELGPHGYVTTDDILDHMGIAGGDQRNSHTIYVNRIMKGLGYARRRARKGKWRYYLCK